MSRRLVIVYNANAGILAGVMDSVHKIVSPSTYPCQLCAVTYGLTSMRREWRAFLDETGLETVFHHRPDFRAAFPHAADWPLPLVAVEDGGQLTQLVTAADFTAIPDLPTLIRVVRERLAP
ncbi:hypothetical protein CAP39_03595 [Sphingomonas sp. IBVSS1]|nr:hypothetical protein CAP39_03595 [Sphingomonas sp. IBVSS1]